MAGVGASAAVSTDAPAPDGGSMRVGVVTFPGSLDDGDARRAVAASGAEAVALWHGDRSLADVDAVVLPGGFSYGDYLRAGAIARFAPIMEQVVDAARGGMPVLGICNGFQVLCESHLLPGALICNDSRRFVCRGQRVRIENTTTSWTSAYGGRSESGEVARDCSSSHDGGDGRDEGAPEVVIPIKNQDGGFVADAAALDRLEGEGLVVARYVGGNPNGSYRDIAGIRNPAGNVVGLMPHPEHAIDPLTGVGSDGLGFFHSVLERTVAAAS